MSRLTDARLASAKAEARLEQYRVELGELAVAGVKPVQYARFMGLLGLYGSAYHDAVVKAADLAELEAQLDEECLALPAGHPWTPRPRLRLLQGLEQERDLIDLDRGASAPEGA